MPAFIIGTQSTLCREGYMLLRHHRNADYIMLRKLYDSASPQKRRTSYAERVRCFCFIIETQSILCREGYLLSLHHRNAAYPIQRKLCASTSQEHIFRESYVILHHRKTYSENVMCFSIIGTHIQRKLCASTSQKHMFRESYVLLHHRNTYSEKVRYFSFVIEMHCILCRQCYVFLHPTNAEHIHAQKAISFSFVL